MPTSDEFVPSEFLSAMFYGGPKSGKTFCAGTAPLPYFLVFGSALELDTLRSKTFIEKHGRRKFFYDVVKESLGPRGRLKTPHAFDQACDLLDAALEKKRKGDWPFETIVVDNATVGGDFAMNKALEATYGLATNKAKTAFRQRQERGVAILQQGDYGAQQQVMEDFISWLFQLDVHLIMVCHEYEVSRRTPEGQTTPIGIRPLFIGRQRETAPLYFSNVWHFSPVGSHQSRIFRVQTEGDGFVLAGTRSGGVLKVYENDLNFTEVIRRFREAGALLPAGSATSTVGRK